MKKFGKVNKLTESNTVLVSNIPASKNAISRVYNYFKKYGKINSLWVEGTEATIVYDSTVSARKALNDPMSLMNNRFIKIQYQYQENKCKANLKQYIDEEKVNKFSKEVNNNIQALIQNTEKLKKELFEQNKLKNQQAKLSLPVINESNEVKLDVERKKSKKDAETIQKIEDLQKQKTKLIIEAAKIANNNDGSSDFQNQIQSYKDQIEEIQAKIDLYQYEGNSDHEENESVAGNENDNIDLVDNNNNATNNDIEKIEIYYEEVEDVKVKKDRNNLNDEMKDNDE